MTTYSLSVIHLGNVADLDPIDGNATAENASALLGTYYGASDPAAGHITTLTVQDTNFDTLINSNDTVSPEPVSFDLGSGPVSTQYDALFNLDVTVTFGAGSGQAPYNGLGGVIQTETGDLFFVMVDDNEGFGTNPLDDAPVESITINSISAFGSQGMAEASDTQSFVPCFVSGTRIRTRRGLVMVEDLRVGDAVETLDDGHQTVRWVGCRYLSPERLETDPNLGAIRIAAGALGAGYPVRDLVVSPQHRVLVKSRIARRMTGEPEVIVPAGKLLRYPGIRQVPGPRRGVQYHHFACARHQLVWANGAAAETLLLGPEVRRGVGPAALKRLEAIAQAAGPGTQAPARPIVQRGGFLNTMLRRHIKNAAPLVCI